MLTNYDEELRFLEEWIEKPKEEEDYITIVDTKHSRMLSCSMMKEEIES